MSFKSFGVLGKKSRPKMVGPRPPRDVKLLVAKSINYERIRREVMKEIAKLNIEDRYKIPLNGTLPEIMVALALVWLGYQFQTQYPVSGGKLRIGGAVVDTLVYIGPTIIVIRVQGNYWHSLPERKMKDAVQMERLRSMGYKVVDLWEQDIYYAWIENRLRQFVDDSLHGAL